MGPTGTRVTLTATLCHGWQRRPRAGLLAQLGRRTGSRASTPASEAFFQKRTLSRLSVISTLNWQNLAQGDYLIPGPWNRPGLALQVAQDPHDLPRVGLSYPSHWQEKRSSFGGFLYYYHEPTRMPPLAGELRFRITPSPDPASFRTGSDLRTEGRYGFVWGISLSAIAQYETFWPIRRLLTVVDGIVPRDVMDLADRTYIPSPGTARGMRYLHEFGQPFILPFSQSSHSFAFVGERRVAVVNITKLVSFQGHNTLQLPLSGTAVCCFEPSLLPDHVGKRVVVIRVLHHLNSDPIRPNPSYIGSQLPPELHPQPGQLLVVMRHRQLRPWTYDVDEQSSRVAASLRVLFENAAKYGYRKTSV